MNERVAVQRVRVQAVPGAQTSGVANVFWRTERFTLGYDAHDEEGQREEHCVWWRVAGCGEDGMFWQVAIVEVCQKRNSSAGRIVVVYVGLEDDCASANIMPLA